MPGKPLVAMKRPENGLPEDVREHMRLMCDIVALAIQMDKTRIASMLMCRDLSGLFYPFLDVRDAHHLASHHDTSDGYERITRHYVTQLAYLAGKLNSMPEGKGTGTGQHLHSVALQHVLGFRPRQFQAAHPYSWRPGRNAGNRPGIELPGQGRREPQGLQPLPLDYGQDGSKAGAFWRFRHAPNRHLGKEVANRVVYGSVLAQASPKRS